MHSIHALKWRLGKISGSTFSLVGEGEEGLRLTWSWRYERPRNWTPARRVLRNKVLAEKVMAWIEEHGLAALRAPENDDLIDRLAGDNSPDAPVMRAP